MENGEKKHAADSAKNGAETAAMLRQVWRKAKEVASKQ